MEHMNMGFEREKEPLNITTKQVNKYNKNSKNYFITKIIWTGKKADNLNITDTDSYQKRKQKKHVINPQLEGSRIAETMTKK